MVELKRYLRRKKVYDTSLTRIASKYCIGASTVTKWAKDIENKYIENKKVYKREWIRKKRAKLKNTDDLINILV